jgi:hypothetical protein
MKLDSARRIAMALPGVSESPHFTSASWRVGGKIFATAPPANADDGELLHVFVADDDRERALALQPACTDKLMWGAKVVGVRVRLAGASSAYVRELLAQAWRRKAPKSLQQAPR